MLSREEAVFVRDSMVKLFGIRSQASALVGLNLSQVGDKYNLDDKQLSELGLMLFMYKLVSGHYDDNGGEE